MALLERVKARPPAVVVWPRESVEEGTTWVRMIPVDTSSGFERMELGFEAGSLTRMVFFDNLEQTTFVALAEVEVNEPIPAERFEFVAPEGVDVIGRPASSDNPAP